MTRYHFSSQAVTEEKPLRAYFVRCLRFKPARTFAFRPLTHSIERRRKKSICTVVFLLTFGSCKGKPRKEKTRKKERKKTRNMAREEVGDFYVNLVKGPAATQIENTLTSSTKFLKLSGKPTVIHFYSGT